MKHSGVYEILNVANGQRYIGSATSLRKRFAAHRCYLRKGTHHSPKLQRAWIKHGESAFEFKVLLRCGLKDLLLYEARALVVFKPDYNIAVAVGNAMRGRQHTLETKQRISAALKGRVVSLETRRRISVAGRGRHVSIETREKRRQQMIGNTHAKGNASQRGRTATAETRAKLSASHMGKTPTPETRAKMSAAGVARWAREKARR